MASIIRKDKPEITDNGEVKAFLLEKGVEYDHWIVPDSAKSLTAKESLSDSEKDDLLSAVENRFEDLKQKEGYQSRDLIVMHPNVQGIDDMIAKFNQLHFHTDAEVRYILDGSGYFGFHLGGEKFLVHVVQDDFISVPKNTHHWFYLDDKKRIKAVRYFQDKSGWVPHYVEGKASLD